MDFEKPLLKRRHLLKLGATGAVSLPIIASSQLWDIKSAQAEELSNNSQSLDGNAALQKLMDGNERFIHQRPKYPDQSKARVKEVAYAQHPFATVLTCADSRVPVELIFDQGVGDVFDIRIAGNIATPEVIGSIEYAVVLLGTPLLMVLGHERCGAVTAAVENEVLPGEISSFVNAILPAIKDIQGTSAEAVDLAVIANVAYQIEQLKKSQLLTKYLESGALKVVGGRYDLDTGKVKIIS